MAPYKRQDISNQRQFNYLFGNMFRFTSKTISKIRITGLFSVEYIRWFSPQRISNAEGVSTSWRNHEETGSLTLCQIFCRKLSGSNISWTKMSMYGPQSAWFAKCAGPSKVRKPTQSTRTELWVDGTLIARICAKCMGCSSIARVALTARRQLRGAVSGLQRPRTSLAHASQCTLNATVVPLAWAAMSCNRPALSGFIHGLLWNDAQSLK